MVAIRQALNAYKKLKITKSQLCKQMGESAGMAAVNHPVVVNSKDVICALQAVKKGRLSAPNLVDWVNIMWFSDFFTYSDKDSDCMASVMTELEELDEKEFHLTMKQIDQYIAALEKNEELP